MMEAGSNDDNVEVSAAAAAGAAPASPIDGEDALLQKLGFSLNHPPLHTPVSHDDSSYKVVPNPKADEVDLSDLRGTKAPTTAAERLRKCFKEC
jgi:hypothetical protein